MRGMCQFGRFLMTHERCHARTGFGMLWNVKFSTAKAEQELYCHVDPEYFDIGHSFSRCFREQIAGRSHGSGKSFGKEVLRPEPVICWSPRPA